MKIPRIKVSNGIRIFHTVYSGINGIPIFRTVFSGIPVLFCNGKSGILALSLKLNTGIHLHTGIPLYRYERYTGMYGIPLKLYGKNKSCANKNLYL